MLKCENHNLATHKLVCGPAATVSSGNLLDDLYAHQDLRNTALEHFLKLLHTGIISDTWVPFPEILV